jgi:hypothetical protein
MYISGTMHVISREYTTYGTSMDLFYILHTMYLCNFHNKLMSARVTDRGRIDVLQ